MSRISSIEKKGLSWPRSYGSWIYNYMCNLCLLPLKSWVRVQIRRGVLDTKLCDIVDQWLATGLWFSLGTQVSSINKTDHHVITKILLKVALNTINQNPINWEKFLNQLLQHNKVLIYEFIKKKKKIISFSIIPDTCTYMYLFSDTASK